MVTFVPSFVDCANESLATLDMVADHIDYIVKGVCPSWLPQCNPNLYPGNTCSETQE